MALKNTLDATIAGERLAAWLPDALGVDGPVAVSDLNIPQASGMSSQTVLFEASWQDGGERVSRGLVARIPPEDGGLFPDYDIGREAQVMAALAEHSAAPVPRVLAHEASGDVLDGQFLLLERVYGDVPGDDPPFTTAGWVVDLAPDQRATMFDSALETMAAIQKVDPVAVGLGDLRRDDLEYWKRFYAWAAGERRSPTIDAALEILDRDRPSDDGPLVVTWGDARFGNLMFGPDQRVTGVFDWEMATLGRPEVDFGYFLFFDRIYSSGLGIPRLTGFPERVAAIACFEELGGREMRNIDWFEAYGALRGAILIVRVGNVMIDLGLLPPDAAMPFNNPAAQTLASLLELPPPSGEAGWITGNR